MEIQVNGRFHHVDQRALTYADIAAIACWPGVNDVEIHWRPYEAHAAAKGGELKPGESVIALEGMIFFVRRRV